jgi:hypothetical protein
MYDCLEAMNFRKTFIDSIKTLYANIQTAVINNGQLSAFFKPSRGIRQGCPISANLFVTIVEILANTIRNNNRIEGIKIGKKEFKISQFADDTCLYLKNQESLKTVLLLLDIFTKCAGLKMNKEKSEAIWIGASSNYRHKPYGLKWTNNLIKSLGIYIGTDKTKMVNENFNIRLKNNRKPHRNMEPPEDDYQGEIYSNKHPSASTVTICLFSDVYTFMGNRKV